MHTLRRGWWEQLTLEKVIYSRYSNTEQQTLIFRLFSFQHQFVCLARLCWPHVTINTSVVFHITKTKTISFPVSNSLIWASPVTLSIRHQQPSSQQPSFLSLYLFTSERKREFKMKSKRVRKKNNNENVRAAGKKSKCRWESKRTIRRIISCSSFRGQSQKEEASIINMESPVSSAPAGCRGPLRFTLCHLHLKKKKTHHISAWRHQSALSCTAVNRKCLSSRKCRGFVTNSLSLTESKWDCVLHVALKPLTPAEIIGYWTDW